MRLYYSHMHTANQLLNPSTQIKTRGDYWNSCIRRNHNIQVASSPNWT